MKPLKCFKYSLVYAILNFILLWLTGYICFNEYIPTYFITLYIFFAIVCTYKAYDLFKCVYFRPIRNLLQASVIASLDNIKAIHSNSSINRCLQSQFGRRTKYMLFLIEEKYKYLLISSNETIYSRIKNE